MKPTLGWLKKTFDEYNRKYFGGKLKTPIFKLFSPEGTWGFYKPNGTYNRINRKVKVNGPGEIMLNGRYSRDEKDLIGTLLHEMIHMYIFTVLKKYPKNQHGDDFQMLSNHINQDGWGISEKNERKDTDIENDDTENVNNDDNINNQDNGTEQFFCLLHKPKGQNYIYWGVRCEENQINKVIQLATQLKPQGVTTVYIYNVKSMNISKFPIVDASLKGVGGKNVQELINIISSIINENLSVSNFKLVKSVNL